MQRCHQSTPVGYAQLTVFMLIFACLLFVLFGRYRAKAATEVRKHRDINQRSGKFDLLRLFFFALGKDCHDFILAGKCIVLEPMGQSDISEIKGKRSPEAPSVEGLSETHKRLSPSVFQEACLMCHHLRPALSLVTIHTPSLPMLQRRDVCVCAGGEGLL